MLSVMVTHFEVPSTIPAVNKRTHQTLQEKFNVVQMLEREQTASLVMAEYNIVRRTVTKLSSQSSRIKSEIEASGGTLAQKMQKFVNVPPI